MNKIIWTEEEIDFLKNNYNKLSNNELSVKLSKTKKNITRTLQRMELKKDLDSVRQIRTRRNKEVGTDLSFEYISCIAKKYNSRGEFYQFDTICYNKAVKEKWINNICSHMVIKNISIPQLMMKDLLEHLLKESCSYNDRKVIKPLEIDCYFNKWNLGWEYDGRHYHCDKKDKIKKQICLDKGIHLFNINEKSKEYRNYDLNIKKQVIAQIDKINTITNLKITKEDIIDYKIVLKLPNQLTLNEKNLVFGKKMSEIKNIDLELFKRIKKYKLYQNIDLEIVFDLKINKKFDNIENYITFVKSNYNSFADLCEKEHPHRLLKKWGIDIKIIHELFKK